MPRKRKIEIEAGSGNVFADLGLDNPEEEILRAELVLQLVRAIRRLGITQAEAAKRLGVDAPKISALVNGKLAGFSIERLLRFLTLLGQDVRVIVSAHPAPTRKKRQGRLRVEAA